MFEEKFSETPSHDDDLIRFHKKTQRKQLGLTELWVFVFNWHVHSGAIRVPLSLYRTQHVSRIFNVFLDTKRAEVAYIHFFSFLKTNFHMLWFTQFHIEHDTKSLKLSLPSLFTSFSHKVTIILFWCYAKLVLWYYIILNAIYKCFNKIYK